MIARIPPLRVRFQYLAKRFLNVCKTQPHHPLNNLLATGKVLGIDLFGSVEAQTNLIKFQNYPFYKLNFDYQQKIKIPDTLPDKQICIIFKDVMQNSGRLEIYTDASKMENGVGCGFFFKALDCKCKMKVEKDVSIFVAEGLAIANALKHLYNEDHHEAGRYRIISDSLSVISTLQNLNYTAKAHPVIIKIREIVSMLEEENFNVDFMWTPSHCGIDGNEIADTLAKAAIEQPDELKRYKWHPSDLKKSQLQLQQAAWKAGWTLSEKGRFTYSILPNPSTLNWFKDSKLNRRSIVLMNRIIANHTCCAASLQRFNVVNDPLCACGANYETVSHLIFECPICEPESREKLSEVLKKTGLNHVKELRDLLAICIEKSKFNVMRSVCEFIIHNNISI